jgi:hypothetical protein
MLRSEPLKLLQKNIRIDKWNYIKLKRLNFWGKVAEQKLPLCDSAKEKSEKQRSGYSKRRRGRTS